MVGLGVQDDRPPNQIQPPLRDGIHLRWALPRRRGFPWHGFYLYRRAHLHGDPYCLTRETRSLFPGPWPGFFLDVSFARISSDTRLVLTEDFPDPAEVEIDLDGRAYLRVVFTPAARARRVILRLGFRARAQIDITALWDGIPMETRRVPGQAGQMITEEIQTDSITEVLISSGPARLIDLCYVPVTEDAGRLWQPVPGLRRAICLPVTQPGYPCSPGVENLADSRNTARNRIRYGLPDRLTPAPVPTYNAGTVAVTNDSPIVAGAGVNWARELTGLVFQVAGEVAAYGIAAVLSSNRIVLNRPYSGATAAGRAYTIQRDPFGQLHDYLAHIVTGGPAAGAMADRVLPQPIAAPGTVGTENGSDTVAGAGTNWTAALDGLRFRIIGAAAGTVTAVHESDVVTGAGTAWGSDLTGMELEIEGDDRSYIIAEVNAANWLRLNRHYLGHNVAGARYLIAERPLYGVQSIDAADRLTLDRPYSGSTAAGREYVFTVFLQPEGAQREAPHLPRFRPLDIVLLAALDPAVAQMVGLYWVDQTADPNEDYDYLILADDNGLGGDPIRVLDAWVQSHYTNADGFIAYNLRAASAQPLTAPSGTRVFALPGVTLQTNLDDVAGSAGVLWNFPANDDGILLPRSPLMYHIWRADLGSDEPVAPPAADEYILRTVEGPIVVANLNPPAIMPPQRPPDWPPFRLYFIDGNLREGWYSFQINGIDIFGRHSANSSPAEWRQWAPMPNLRPWYYTDPEGERQIHPYALGLLDKTPPPVPAAVEAYALDPNDPTILRDADYMAWWAALTRANWYQDLSAQERANVIGLRVRWRWTSNQQIQAPDTREFRIYFQPGLINVRLGRITATAAADAQFTIVTTDIANAQPANAYAGARLHRGNDNWEIVASEAGTPLQLRVRNIGPDVDIAPPAPAPCSIVIPEEHALFVDYTRSLAWQERFHVVPYGQNWSADPDGDGRIYEVFLPDPAGPVQAGVPLTTTLGEPVVYAHIGVSAADNKRHSADNARWSDPARWAQGLWGGADRYGNESHVGGSATIFRVRRERPDRPVPPLDGERVFATPADYHSRSYYTYRWVPQRNLKTHIFRALDEALFRLDWTLRAVEVDLDPAQLEYFPEGDPRWDEAKRQQVADELNALNDFSRDAAGSVEALAYYRGLSNDALRALAGLDRREQAFTQITIQPLDPDDPNNADRHGPDNAGDYAPNPNLRAYIDTLDGRATNRYFYRAAYVDGAQNRSLMSLSGPPVWLPNVVPPRAPVITRITGGDRQITLRWASNREPDLAEYRVYRATSQEATRDLRLMTEVATIAAPQAPAARPTEEAWMDDTVDANRNYWYRVTAVDDAGNESTPSQLVQGRAYRASPPLPPEIMTANWVNSDGAWIVRLVWTMPEPGEVLVQRRPAGAVAWATVAAWLPTGQEAFDDAGVAPDIGLEYRLKAQEGPAWQSVYSEIVAVPPRH
jgi:hypothetical protein